MLTFFNILDQVSTIDKTAEFEVVMPQLERNDLKLIMLFYSTQTMVELYL